MEEKKTCEVIPLWLGAANAYLLKGTDGNYTLIDCAMYPAKRRILKAMRDKGIDPKQLKLLIITHGHADHMGTSSALRALSGLKTMVHAKDAQVFHTGVNPQLHFTSKKGWLLNLFTGKKIQGFTPYDPEIVVNGELPLYDFGIPGKLLETPGHTGGSVSVLLDDGTFFAGDLIMGGVFGKGKPEYSMFVENMSQLKESIRRVLAISPKIIYTGHGGPFSMEEVRSAFQDLIS